MSPSDLQMIDVVGATLECRWFGAPDRQAIVMLHEGLGSAAMWRDFPERLADRTGWPVFAFSRPGYGLSSAVSAPREPDYMHREAEALPAILEAVAIQRPVLFGHSDGASIALIYARRFPGAAQALVLEAPHVFVEDLSISSIAAIGEAYAGSGMSRRLSRYHRDPDAAFWGWNRIWLDPRFRTWNIEAGLERIAAPTLLIQGEDDEYGTLEQLDRIEARVAGARRCVLPHCGHAPHRDQPEAVLASAAALLQALPAREPA